MVPTLDAQEPAFQPGRAVAEGIKRQTLTISGAVPTNGTHHLARDGVRLAPTAPSQGGTFCLPLTTSVPVQVDDAHESAALQTTVNSSSRVSYVASTSTAPDASSSASSSVARAATTTAVSRARLT